MAAEGLAARPATMTAKITETTVSQRTVQNGVGGGIVNLSSNRDRGLLASENGSSPSEYVEEQNSVGDVILALRWDGPLAGPGSDTRPRSRSSPRRCPTKGMSPRLSVLSTAAHVTARAVLLPPCGTHPPCGTGPLPATVEDRRFRRASIAIMKIITIKSLLPYRTVSRLGESP